MPRWIDMTDAQRDARWSRHTAERKAGAADAIAQAEQDVTKALRRWAQNPQSLLRQRSLKEADARLEAVKAEFQMAPQEDDMPGWGDVLAGIADRRRGAV